MAFRKIEDDINYQVESLNTENSGFSFRKIEDDVDYTKLKANNVFSLDGSNTNASTTLNNVVKSTGKFMKETTKGFLRGSVAIEKGAGVFFKFLGDNLHVEDGVFRPEETKRLNIFSNLSTKLGDTLANHADFLMGEPDEDGFVFDMLKEDEELFKGSIIENPSVTRVASTITSALPSLAFGGVAYKTLGAGAGYLLMSGVDSADIYEKAKEKGLSQGQANLLYTGSMLGTAAIDKALSPLEKMFGDSPLSVKKRITKAIFDGLTEGGAESSQTVLQNAVMKYGIDDTQKLFEGVVEAAIGGFGSGAIMSATYKDAEKSLKEKGATDQDIDNMVNMAGEYVSKNADELNSIAFQTLDKGIGELNKFIEAHKGTPEAEKAIRTKKELDEVYNNVYTELKKLGAKEVADSQAKVIQGITLWGSQATGMSPMEYYNKRMPKVQAMDYQEFVKKYQTNVVSDALKVDARKEGIALLQADLDKLKSGKYGNNEAKKVSLSQFLKSKGGIKESGGELKNIGANKQVVGLVNNKSGMTLDEATHLAWENGYIQSTERPEINTLLNLLSDDVSGTHKVYKVEDATNNDSEVRYFEELSRALSEANVDLNKDSAEVAFDKLEAYSKKLQEAEIDRQVEGLDEDEQERFYMMVENGVSKADAYDSLKPKYDDDYIPFQESLDVAKQNAELDKVNPKYEGETININGVEKTVYNSNGDRIAMSEPALQNFYNWFGDSKVVDEQGRPLVVYHGTNELFDTFDTKKIGYNGTADGAGFNFTTSRDYAESFTFLQNGVMPLYLKIENPVKANEKVSISEEQLDKIINRISSEFLKEKESIKSWGETAKILRNARKNARNASFFDMFLSDVSAYGNEYNEDANVYSDFRRIVKEETGIDGYENDYKGHKVYVAFEPNQIKSTSNRGTYSESDNIYYQMSYYDGLGSSKSVSDVKKLLKGLQPEEEVRLMFDKNKGYWFVIDAKDNIHQDMIVKAFEQGMYPEFRNSNEAIQYFDENYNSDDEYLIRFKADSFIDDNDLQKLLDDNIPSDEYKYGYSVKNADGSGYVLFARSLWDLADTPLKSIGKEAEIWERNPYKMTEFQNVEQKQLEDNGIFYQSAFAGSRVDYDRPSLEAIGSGEGAQVHGWGLYYALNKDVAEGYRKAFIRSERETVFPDSREEVAIETYLKNNKDKQATIKELSQMEKEAQSKLGTPEEDVLAYVNISQAVDYMRYIDDATLEQQTIELENSEKGQVHEVDIPENPYLLDEGLTFNEQPEFVKDGLRKALTDDAFSKYFEDMSAEEFSSTEIDDFSLGMTGGNIYDRISNLLGSDKDASLLLNKYGIKGITYEGGQDGRCFVIFNPDDVKVIQKFYQGEQSAPRGAYIENLDGKGVIFLFEKADASTFMHETAHFFRKELREFGDAKSLKMLNKVEQWENQEFDSRYRVEYADGKYNVTDVHGNNVYTGFNSISQAREYGRNEIFARGFEAYLREGKAPNNYLKQAFRNFWSWLRSLVKTAKDLKVELNDDIKSVYAEILGGEDLDFYLSSSPDEFIQKRTATEIERVSLIEEAISKSQANKVKKGRFDNVFKEKTESAKDRNTWWKNAMIPLSTRAKRVNQGLKNKLRAYDYRTYTKLNEYLARVQPFVEKWATFNEDDAIAFDLALKNGYIEKQVEIVKKYDAYNEYLEMKDLLNHLFDEAIKVQINLGYTADYFPRQIEDVDGFMTYIYGSEMASQMRRAIKEAGLEGATNEMKAEFVNKYLRGFNRVDLNKPLIGNTKDRTIDIVTAELNQFYKPSMQALFSYIDGMNNSIESRKYFGFDMENIDQSIGAYVDGLIMNGLIKPEDDAEVRSILQARFKAKGVTNKYLKTMKNLSYIYTMGGINSAITQIDDLSVAIYKAGFWNTVNSIFSKNKEGLTREDLGLERIGQEFVEASTSSKAVSEVFKLTGLDKIDAFGKNTLINATFDKFQKLANENPKQLEELIAPIMENETKQTIEDIKNGVISDNVKLLMFNELADVQPIALSEMPEYYLTSGNGRVFYMLKTFMVRRIDIFRNECFDKIRKGEVKEGVQNLFKLSVLMILMGMGKDRIIDYIFGRDFDLSDAIVNNVLGLVGMSKYSLYKARNEGASGLISSMAVPPLFAPLSDLSVDLYKSLFSKKGKDISDYEVWKGIPLIGRFYYWWLGGGRTKIEKKTKKKLK